MGYPVYMVPDGDTLPHLFDSFDGGTGASITLTGLAVTDIEIYKDGGVTQRSSDSGYTLLDTDGIDFDGTTGIHGFSIDLSDNTDAGFYSVGSWFHVVISSITIDAQTVNFVACAFRIMAAEASAGVVDANIASSDDIDLTATQKTSVNSEVDTALTDIGLDHLVSAAVVGADVTDNSIVAKMVSSQATADWDDFVNTTDALQAIRDHIGDGTNLSEAGGTGDHLTAVPYNSNWDADIQSECNDALVANGLDHLLAASVTGTDVTDNSIVARLVSASATADWDDFANTTDSLQAIRDRGDAAWTTGAGGSDRLLMVDTTIATLASQTSFTLTAGSSDDDAYNNCTIVIEDAATSAQKAVGLISDYTGASKTVTLKYDPGIFTMAVSDKVYVLAENALKSTDQNRQLDVTATGAAGIDWGNVENPTTANDLSATDIQLCDTVTTNSDMRGTDSAALASVCTAARLAELDAANIPADIDTLKTNVPDVISLAAINSEMDSVLDTAIPASPTANSINDRLNDIRAVICGKVTPSSAGGTLTLAWRNPDDTATQITHAVTESNGNRTES